MKLFTPTEIKEKKQESQIEHNALQKKILEAKEQVRVMEKSTLEKSITLSEGVKLLESMIGEKEKELKVLQRKREELEKPLRSSYEAKLSEIVTKENQLQSQKEELERQKERQEAQKEHLSLLESELTKAKNDSVLTAEKLVKFSSLLSSRELQVEEYKSIFDTHANQVSNDLNKKQEELRIRELAIDGESEILLKERKQIEEDRGKLKGIEQHIESKQLTLKAAFDEARKKGII